MLLPSTLQTFALTLTLGAALALPAAGQITKTRLAEIIPGTETVTLVTNGDFEDDSSGNDFLPTGWNRFSNMFYGLTGVPQLDATFGSMARFHIDGGGVGNYNQTLTLLPNTDYVLSAYMAHLGDAGANQGGTVEIDLGDAPGEAGISISQADPDVAQGYFVSGTFTTTDTGTAPNLRIFMAHQGVTTGWPLQPVGGLWDNVAVTLASTYVAPSPNNTAVSINNFSTPDQIVISGDPIDLAFDTLNADTLTIDNAVGALTPDSGTAITTPPSDLDTTYTLTATNTGGTTNASVTVRAVSQGSATYQYIRFTPIRNRGDLPGSPATPLIQIDEFEFFNGLTQVIPVSATGVDTGAGGSPGGEGPDKLIDGVPGTKWLSFDKNDVSIIFDLGASTTIDNYRMTTGNDAAERDAVAWTLEGSDDQANWTVIDSISVQQGNPTVNYNFLPPVARGVATQNIPIPVGLSTPLPVIVYYSAFPEQILVDGTGTDLDWGTLNASTLEIDQGVGVVPGPTDFVAITPSANTDTIYTLTATNPSGDTTSFPASVRSVAQGSATYQYVRFTPLRLAESLSLYGGANSIQLAEFLFENGGVPVVPIGVTNPGGNVPGAGEAADKVIDGDFNSKWLDFNKLGLVFDFGSAVTFDTYYWVLGGDAPERDPVAWVLEGSNDGSTWSLIDSVDKDRATGTQDLAFYHGYVRGDVLPPIPVPAPSALPPSILKFVGDAPFLVTGEPLVLTWETSNTTAVTLDDGTGPVAVSASGVQNLAPIANTTYTLTATSAWGDIAAVFSTVLVTPAITEIAYPNFDSAGDELSLLSDASIVNDFANVPLPGNASRLRITPDLSSQQGSAWFRKRLDFSQGFETFFGLHLLAGSTVGADGMSFMIQNTPEGNGADLDDFNEEGLPANSLNIKFDSYMNAGETSAGFIQVKAGTTVLATAILSGLSGTDPDDLTSDDFNVAPYMVQITYVPGDLDVFFDGILVIDSVAVDLGAIGAVDGSGTGYTGFSARTGADSENHDVTSWFLTTGAPAQLEITDFSFDFGADTAVFTFTSDENELYSVLESTNGGAFTPLATGIPGASGVSETTTSSIPFVQTPTKLFRIKQE